jgi:DMSO reductase family type II enzyme heme b subunit
LKFRIPAFWQAVLLIAGAFLIFKLAFPPFLPRSLLVTYLLITLVGVVLYFSSDDRLLTEFKAPIIALLRDEDRATLRRIFLVLLPLLFGYTAYESLKPSLETPLELRQVHPAPPAELNVYGKRYDLATLENPIRTEVLALLDSDAASAWETYREAVQAGSTVYYRNCFYCHGDLLGGDGHFAGGLDPLPTNFRDVGTIAQLQESYLFWRITTGGPGLPKDGMPWKSAMPVWHEMLSEGDVWNVITFLYDNVEQVPRMWDQDVSRAVSSMQGQIVSQRDNMSGDEIYQYRCAVCHGEEGAGDGPAAAYLYPRPRDFTMGLFKFKTSPGDLPPRDEDLFSAIKIGLPGTSMPGWSALISDDQIKELITVIKRFDISAIWAPEDAPWDDFDDDGHYTKADLTSIMTREPTDDHIPYSAESIALGDSVYEENCRKCHGTKGRGNITSGKFLEDDWGYATWPRDLTKHWTWRGNGVAAAQSRDDVIRNVYTRLSVGIPGTPMPAHRAAEDGEEDAITQADRWHVANYAYSLGENTVPPGRRRVIAALEINGKLPVNVDDEVWQQAPASTFGLVPNVIKDERLFTPLNNSISVRALYNDVDIVFLLEVNDRTDSRPGGPVMTYFSSGADTTVYPDAVAIQFPQKGAYATAPVEKPLYRHGDAAHRTTIWYWNAGSVEPEVAPRAVLLDASGSDSQLVSRDSAANSFTAQGNWEDGRWQVLMKRPRNNDDSPDIEFPEGRFIPVSFANWDGNNGEIGSRHTFTMWYWLLLPPDTNRPLVYGVPVGLILLSFLAGLLLVRSQRRKSSDVH